MAQPMSSWQRTYVIHAVFAGISLIARSACTDRRTSRVASIDQIWTIRLLW